MRVTVSLAVFWFSAFAVNANAADFKSFDSKDGKTRIDLVGEIEPGDSDKLKTIIHTANDASRVVVTIRLNSPGGNLLESVKIADVVRAAGMSTSVLSGSQCASGCFIIFSAGREKFAHYQTRIGVHGASENGRETAESGAATVGMARILKELGVPPKILGKMVVTPPEEMVWLSVDELRSMETKMFGKPSQLSELTPNQLPGDIPVGPKATYQNNPQPTPTWKDLVDRAFEVSAVQNHGRANSSRACQPEIKVCTVAVFYRDSKGTDMMIRVTENLNGKIIQREVCTFNSFGDIRVCFDWDKGSTHRDMKNNRGQWYGVADR